MLVGTAWWGVFGRDINYLIQAETHAYTNEIADISETYLLPERLLRSPQGGEAFINKGYEHVML